LGPIFCASGAAETVDEGPVEVLAEGEPPVARAGALSNAQRQVLGEFPAGTSRQPAGFWPDHSGEKSPEPAASARARRGSHGGSGRGEFGCEVTHGSKLAHRPVDNAATSPAAKKIRQSGVASTGAFKGRALGNSHLIQCNIATTAELIRVKRHKFPDAHRRSAGHPRHAIRHPVIPTRPVQLGHRHQMPRQVLRQPHLF